jgi:Raf kinase inhibitor-like YbhB/YbcL family protein
MPLTITSPAFRNGEVIPTRHTRDGENLSPPLEWRGAPPETKSFVLIVEDPDAPSGTFRHWVIYNIPAGEAGLPEWASGHGRGGAGEGVNGFRNARYDGPQPPKGYAWSAPLLFTLRGACTIRLLRPPGSAARV